MKLLPILTLLVTVSPAYGQDTPTPIADHHLHVLSPKLIADWKAAGARFSRDDDSYGNPEKFCETHKIQQGFLISMAHLYTTEDLGIAGDPKREHAAVSRENDFVAKCVKASPERFVGFFSVNPLREWAFDEMDRCRKVPQLRGMKLHLPACEVDLNNTKHMDALKKVFAWAAENDVPMLVHISGYARPFTDVEARIFWQQLVKPNPKVHLYLAHLGASGGYNDRSRALFDGYKKLISEHEELAKTQVFFDMSGAILAEAIEGIEPTSPALCKELAEKILEIGIEHFLFASDYPVFSPTNYILALRDRVPLPKAQMDKLFANRSPLFGKVTKGTQ